MKRIKDLEKPQKLDHIIGHEEHIELLKNYNKNNNHPDMLIRGTWGCGKSATIRAMLKEYYKDTFQYNVIHVNASRKSERSIEFIEQLIKKMRISPRGNYNYRVILLEEAEQLTGPAALAMKDAITQYSIYCRLIMISNDPSKIEPGLANRSTPKGGLNFKNPPRDQIINWITKIYYKYYKLYKCKYTKEEIIEFLNVENINPRTTIQDLDYYLNNGKIEKDSIADDSKKIMEKLFQAKSKSRSKKKLLSVIYKMYNDIIINNIYNDRTIIKYMFEEAKINFKKYPLTVGKTAYIMADTDKSIIESSNPEIQMVNMLYQLSEIFGV